MIPDITCYVIFMVSPLWFLEEGRGTWTQ